MPSALTPSVRWKYRLLRLLAVVVIAAGVAWLLWPSTDNPYYRGRRLSSYVADLPMAMWMTDVLGEIPVKIMNAPDGPSPQRAAWDAAQERQKQRALEAIFALDERCLPLLITYLDDRKSILHTPDSKLIHLGYAGLEKLGVKRNPSAEFARCGQALLALLMLHQNGCDISPAIPELKEMENENELFLSPVADYILWVVETAKEKDTRDP